MNAQIAVTTVKRGILKPSTRETLHIYWYNFRSNRLSMVGLVIVLISVVLAVFAPYIAPFPEHASAYVDLASASLAPNATFLFGTDVTGRDILSRVIFGFRGALKMAVVVLAISVPTGTFLGLLAGYYHHTWVDTVIMRLTDIFLALPALVLAMTIASLLEPNMTNTMIAVTLSWWPWYTRLVYSMATGYSKEYFIKNAELVGASGLHILFKELLPNCLSPVLTKMALDVGWVILLGASLSFIGLGEQPPIPSFGTMISEGSKYMPEQWWMTAFPALAIVFVILGFNFLGDGIRDMLDRGKQ